MNGRSIQADGQKIARLRKVEGLTQQLLADKVGVSRRTIQNIEKGSGCLPSILQDVADTLGTTYKELLASMVQVPIWTVPYPTNPYFTGRQALLSDMHQAWEARQPMALTQAVHGLGGIGKTQLATQYAYTYAQGYDAIFWLQADNTATLINEYVRLALQLRLVEDREAAAAVEAVKQWLHEHRGWLLIFDNAEAPEEILPYFPTAPSGHILITSRDRVAWQGVTQSYVLEVFERRESVLFLCQRTQQTDEHAASEVADVLGDLPLGLAQAAAYIDALGISMEDYLHLFQSQRQALWQAEQAPFSYDKTVQTTWQLSLDELRNESPASADLLTLCAYFAPDDISLPLLHEGAGTLPQPLAEVTSSLSQLNRIVSVLRRYALIQRNHDHTFSIHRLIQAVTRDQLSSKDHEYWIDISIQLFADTFARLEETPPNGDMLTHLLPHALAIVEHAQQLPESRVGASWELLLYIKLVPKIIAFYGYGSPKVQQIYQRAKRICEMHHVPPELEYRVEYWIAEYFHLRGEHRKNELLCQKLAYLSEQISDDGLRLETSMLYGRTYWALGKFQEAKSQLEKGINLYQYHLHSSHTNDFVHDPEVCMMSYLSHVLWLIGYPEQTLVERDKTILRAQNLQYLENMAFAYHSASTLHLYRREPEKVKYYADISLIISCKANLIHWKMISTINRLWSLYILNRKNKEKEQLYHSVMEWKNKMNNMLGFPFLLATLSEIEALAGDTQLALSRLDDAIEIVEHTNERWWEAEIYRLKGELRLQAGSRDSAAAQGDFERALNIARRQQAKMLELRAAMSLYRLLCDQGQSRAARELLEPIYAWFKEGFDTVDLQEAKHLLQGVSVIS